MFTYHLPNLSQDPVHPPFLIPGHDGLVNDLLPAIYGLLNGLDLKKRQVGQ